MNISGIALVSLFCLLFGPLLRADELLPNVQRELRARKFYFGEFDGHASDETVQAIKKFQEVKGIDKTGQLDAETLRALGFGGTSEAPSAELRQIEECNSFVLRYLRAWEKGEWGEEAAFFTEVVNYYDDQNVSRDFIRDTRARENRQWTRRKAIMLNRIASLEPNHPEQVQVTARIRSEVAKDNSPAKVRTENLVYRLQKTEHGWRIAALKLLE